VPLASRKSSCLRSDLARVSFLSLLSDDDCGPLVAQAASSMARQGNEIRTGNCMGMVLPSMTENDTMSRRRLTRLRASWRVAIRLPTTGRVADAPRSPTPPAAMRLAAGTAARRGLADEC